MSGNVSAPSAQNLASFTCDRFFIGLAGFSSPIGANNLSTTLTTIASEHRDIAEQLLGLSDLPDAVKIGIEKDEIEPERFESLPRTLTNLPDDIDDLKAELAATEAGTREYVKKLLNSARYLTRQAGLIEDRVASGRLDALSFIDSPQELEKLSERIRLLIQRIERLPREISTAEDGITQFAEQIEKLPDDAVAGFNPDHWPPWQVVRYSIEQKDGSTGSYRIAIPHLLLIGPDVDARTPSLGPEIPTEWEVAAASQPTRRRRARNRRRNGPYAEPDDNYPDAATQTLMSHRSDGVGLAPTSPVGNQVIVTRLSYPSEGGDEARTGTMILVRSLSSSARSGYFIPDADDYVYDISETGVPERVFTEIQVPILDEVPDHPAGDNPAPSSAQFSATAKSCVADACDALLAKTEFAGLSKARKQWLPGVETRIPDRFDERADQAATVPAAEMLDTYDAFAGDGVFACVYQAKFAEQEPRPDIDPRLSSLMTPAGLEKIAAGLPHAPRQHRVPAGIKGRTRLLLAAIGYRGVEVEPLTVADTSAYRTPKHGNGNGTSSGISTQLPPDYYEQKIKAAQRKQRRVARRSNPKPGGSARTPRSK